jgi:hypothetical protein
MKSAKGQNRTGDTSIFSAVLYRLSYLGVECNIACLALHVKPLFGLWARLLTQFRLRAAESELYQQHSLCLALWYYASDCFTLVYVRMR